jgi:G3E family GTPase
MTPQPGSPTAPTPLHVLTGFLGSGKTTLLRRVLEATGERIAVLVNEVADLPIDGHLLVDYDEDVLTLPGGCICCALRDDLHESLLRLQALGPNRIVLETSGLADPAPMLGALTADARLGRLVAPRGVIAVVDCERGERLLETEPEFRRQLDLGDRVLLTRCDVAPQRVEPLRQLLAEQFGGRDVRESGEGAVDLDWLFAAPFGGDGMAHRWLVTMPASQSGAVDHGAAVTRSVRGDAPVDIDALQLWLRLATQLDGERLLRVKMVARCAATGTVYALQSAGRSVSPPMPLPRAPRGLAGAEVVWIQRGLPERAERELQRALQQAMSAGIVGRTEGRS